MLETKDLHNSARDTDNILRESYDIVLECIVRMTKETCILEKRDLHIRERDLHKSERETDNIMRDLYGSLLQASNVQEK